MAQLKLNPIPLAQFNVDKHDRILSAEASTIQFERHRSRVFDDACDLGIQVVSHHTGRSVTFIEVGEESNQDDVLCWYLKPMHETDTKYTMVVFND